MEGGQPPALSPIRADLHARDLAAPRPGQPADLTECPSVSCYREPAPCCFLGVCQSLARPVEGCLDHQDAVFLEVAYLVLQPLSGGRTLEKVRAQRSFFANKPCCLAGRSAIPGRSSVYLLPCLTGTLRGLHLPDLTQPPDQLSASAMLRWNNFLGRQRPICCLENGLMTEATNIEYPRVPANAVVSGLLAAMRSGGWGFCSGFGSTGVAGT